MAVKGEPDSLDTDVDRQRRALDKGLAAAREVTLEGPLIGLREANDGHAWVRSWARARGGMSERGTNVDTRVPEEIAPPGERLRAVVELAGKGPGGCRVVACGRRFVVDLREQRSRRA